ncbi:MAG: hypothetical protein KVP17_001170 [Porospora cf. gigantea B]|uniref:uncharacterized protein n=2 Tax=Porospora cf. gigantea B TaxID=2853592 RepID=UPI003571C077|nr:MAG: hypothetical protein KVP17_001170 [Porospora cf. gigantea B]
MCLSTVCFCCFGRRSSLFGFLSLRAGVLSLGLALGSLFMGYVLMLEIYLNSFRMSCAEAVVHVSHFLGHRLRLPELEDLSFSAVYNVIAWQTNTLTNALAAMCGVYGCCGLMVSFCAVFHFRVLFLATRLFLEVLLGAQLLSFFLQCLLLFVMIDNVELFTSSAWMVSLRLHALAILLGGALLLITLDCVTSLQKVISAGGIGNELKTAKQVRAQQQLNEDVSVGLLA